jgi:predicted ATPase
MIRLKRGSRASNTSDPTEPRIVTRLKPTRIATPISLGMKAKWLNIGLVLEKVHIQNFKSLRDCRVSLRPFQVLVGANGSGKSSFLQALEVAAKAISQQSPLDQTFEKAFRRRGSGPDEPVSWDFSFADGFTYKLSTEPTGRTTETASRSGRVVYELSPPSVTNQHAMVHYNKVTRTDIQPGKSCFKTLATEPQDQIYANFLCGMRRYHLDPTALAAPCPVAHKERPIMEPSGKGLVTVLDFLLTSERRTFTKIEDSLREFVPRFQELLLQPGENEGTRTLGIRDVDGWDFSADHLSSGLLLFLGYLVLAYGHQTSVLLLEEPENGIHPQRLQELVELTKALTRAGQVQVIMASHSPFLLDFVEKDEVLVVSRDEKSGETSIYPLLDLPGAAKRAEDYFTGELVFNFPEGDLRH